MELGRELGEDRELAARRADLFLDGLDRPARLDHRRELVDDLRVVPRARKTPQLTERGLRTKSHAIRTVDEHRVVVDDDA